MGFVDKELLEGLTYLYRVRQTVHQSELLTTPISTLSLPYTLGARGDVLTRYIASTLQVLGLKN